MKLPINSQRLYITEFNEDMAEIVHKNSLDDDNRRFVPDEVFETIDRANEILSWLISSYSRNDSPLVYPIILNDGQNIGYVQAVPISGGWEIGYHVAQPFTGNGYAAEAVTVFLPHIMRRIGITEIYGFCRADNIKSRKVLEKCGFMMESDRMGLDHGEKHRIRTYKYSVERNKNKKIGLIQRQYDILSDFRAVYRFLEETYDFNTLNSYLLPHYWEYAHYLQWFDYIRAHRMGLWEDNGNIVGIAAYEMEIGKTHLHTKPEYKFLLPEMLNWAEKELSVKADGKNILGVWIIDKEAEKQKLLRDSGYQLIHSEPVKIFRYENAFHERQLPEGYGVINGNGIDYAKLAECFWRGFDHDEIPPDINTDGNVKVWNAPHADKSLMTVITAPNGEYACALGMWFDEVHKYAYLEPLATVPKYRRMGLATIALTEAMKKTKALGATYCFGGMREFYTVIGFETICNRELWERKWEDDAN